MKDERVQELLGLLDERIEAKHLLHHPFYQAWSEGRLSPETLRHYSSQYYHHVAAFPTYLSAAHARCADPHVRRVILANLVDEEGGERSHPELWLDFAEGLGLGREEARSAAPGEAVRRLIGTFRRLCSGPTAGALAALYAYESQVPEVARAKMEGLSRHYGVAEPRALAYFELHAEMDKAHRAAWRGLLAEMDSEGPLRAAEEALEALWRALDGISHRGAERPTS